MSRVIDKKRAAYTCGYVLKFISAGLALICWISILSVSAVHAADTGHTLTVEQVIVNNSTHTPPETTFTYRLVPKTTDAPMPLGSGLGGYTFTITGMNERPIGLINFNTPGIFIYELNCITGTVPGFTIDRRVYTIEVHVTNDLQVAAIAYINEGTKVPVISFEHVYWVLINEPNEETDRPVTRRPGTITPLSGNPNTTAAPDGLYPSSEPETPREPNIKSGSNPSNSPNSPNSPNTQGSSPRTGDFSNPTLWITLIIIACALLIFLSFVGIKSKGESKGERDN